jgi:hypothetical protein
MPIDLMKPVLDAIGRGTAKDEEQDQRSLDPGSGGQLGPAPPAPASDLQDAPARTETGD